MTSSDKQTRLAHANALIAIIARHGRRFFWRGGDTIWDPVSKVSTFVPNERLARLELRRGRVYFIDDYTQKAVYTHPTPFGNRWRNFTHGGTLRSLVEALRDYIVDGTLIPRWMIVIQQLGKKGLEDNIWGYDLAGAHAVRTEAYALPLIAPAKEPV